MNLSTKKVLVIGLGGLGSPWLKALVHHRPLLLGLMDGDLVEATNLTRQFIHVGHEGMNKAISAEKWLMAQGYSGETRVFPHYINEENTDLLKGFELILDGTDNFRTKYLIESAARVLKIPSLFASGTDKYGQVTYFAHQDPKAPCLSCLYPPHEKMESLMVCEAVTNPEPLMELAMKGLELVEQDSTDQKMWHYEAQEKSWSPFLKRLNPNCHCQALAPYLDLYNDYYWHGEKHHLLFSLKNFSEKEVLSLPAHLPIVLTCETGARARSLCLKLRANGKQNIFWKK